MSDLRTRIADILDDHGLRGVTARETAAEAILELFFDARLDTRITPAQEQP